jgi:hypothetical protein
VADDQVNGPWRGHRRGGGVGLVKAKAGVCLQPLGWHQKQGEMELQSLIFSYSGNLFYFG